MRVPIRVGLGVGDNWKERSDGQIQKSISTVMTIHSVFAIGTDE
jgi:hypothetical protein